MDKVSGKVQGVMEVRARMMESFRVKGSIVAMEACQHR